jgi:hypothetical protein
MQDKNGSGAESVIDPAICAAVRLDETTRIEAMFVKVIRDSKGAERRERPSGKELRHALKKMYSVYYDEAVQWQEGAFGK